MLEAEDLKGVYKEIAQSLGVDIAVEIHRMFKGQQIVFPLKLYDRDYIKLYVKCNYNGHNIRELSQKFGYSDRRIRQILNEENGSDT